MPRTGRRRSSTQRAPGRPLRRSAMSQASGTTSQTSTSMPSSVPSTYEELISLIRDEFQREMSAREVSFTAASASSTSVTQTGSVNGHNGLVMSNACTCFV